EVLRVIDALSGLIVVDGAGPLDDIGAVGTRGRYATARALVARADKLVVVADASPHGIARAQAWIADAIALASNVDTIVIVNRAPSSRFQRGELFGELMESCPVRDVAFVPHDPRVLNAAWNGVGVARGSFTRAIGALA